MRGETDAVLCADVNSPTTRSIARLSVHVYVLTCRDMYVCMYVLLCCVVLFTATNGQACRGGMAVIDATMVCCAVLCCAVLCCAVVGCDCRYV